MMSKRLSLLLVTSTALLFVPALAMLFTTEVDWNLGDFMLGGAMLYGTSFLIDLVTRKVTPPVHRLLITGSILLLLALLWAELAVGLFGTPFGGR